MYYFYGETVKYNERNLEECLTEENIVRQCAYLPFHLTATISGQEKIRNCLSAVVIIIGEGSEPTYLSQCGFFCVTGSAYDVILHAKTSFARQKHHSIVVCKVSIA